MIPRLALPNCRNHTTQGGQERSRYIGPAD